MQLRSDGMSLVQVRMHSEVHSDTDQDKLLHNLFSALFEGVKATLSPLKNRKMIREALLLGRVGDLC
jgi:hypothetical protein